MAERLERIKHFLLPNCCLKRSTVTPSMTDESLSSSSSGSGGGEFAEQTNRQNDNGLEQDERTRHSTEQSSEYKNLWRTRSIHY